MGPENGKAPNLQEGAGLMVHDINGPARKDPLDAGLSIGFQRLKRSSGRWGQIRHRPTGGDHLKENLRESVPRAALPLRNPERNDYADSRSNL